MSVDQSMHVNMEVAAKAATTINELRNVWTYQGARPQRPSFDDEIMSALTGDGDNVAEEQLNALEQARDATPDICTDAVQVEQEFMIEIKLCTGYAIRALSLARSGETQDAIENLFCAVYQLGSLHGRHWGAAESSKRINVKKAKDLDNGRHWEEREDRKAAMDWFAQNRNNHATDTEAINFMIDNNIVRRSFDTLRLWVRGQNKLKKSR